MLPVPHHFDRVSQRAFPATLHQPDKVNLPLVNTSNRATAIPDRERFRALTEADVAARSIAALKKRVQMLAAKGDDSMLELAEAMSELRAIPKSPDCGGPTIDELVDITKLSHRTINYLLKVWRETNDVRHIPGTFSFAQGGRSSRSLPSIASPPILSRVSRLPTPTPRRNSPRSSKKGPRTRTPRPGRSSSASPPRSTSTSRRSCAPTALNTQREDGVCPARNKPC